MNARERFRAVMDFEPVDRTLLWEVGYWANAMRRWYAEGLPRRHGLLETIRDGQVVAGEVFPWDPTRPPATSPRALDIHEYLGMDEGMQRIPVNNYFCPGFKEEVLEEHGEWVLARDEFGVIRRERNDRTTLPAFVGYPVHGWEEWERIKAERLQPTLDGRLPANWDEIIGSYQGRDYPLFVGLRQGFYWAVRNLLGDENVLYTFHDDPALIKDMMDYLADFWVAIYDKVLDDVQADAALIWEDICYKNGPLISPAMVRRFILPNYKKLTACLRDHGIKTVFLDTDGDCWKLIPIFMEGGITGLLPFEVNARMDVVAVRDAFPRLQIIGGIDKVQLAAGKDATDRELQAKVTPAMLRQGGYVPTIDHAVGPEVAWADFTYYRARLAALVSGA